MDARELCARLDRGELVVMTAHEFAKVEPHLTLEHTHDTGLAGPIHVLRTTGGAAVLEFPPRLEQGVARPLAELDAAEAFVRARLAAYERMWDGCGACRPDYFAPPDPR
jgi:hypothetical protein